MLEHFQTPLPLGGLGERLGEPRSTYPGLAVSSSVARRVCLSHTTSVAPRRHGWAGHEPVSGAGATRFQWNASPIWHSTWLQHGKPPLQHPMPHQPVAPAPHIPHGSPFSQPHHHPSCSRSRMDITSQRCRHCRAQMPVVCPHLHMVQGPRSHLQSSRKGTRSSPATQHRDTSTELKLLVPEETFWYQLYSRSYQGSSLPEASYPAQGQNRARPSLKCSGASFTISSNKLHHRDPAPVQGCRRKRTSGKIGQNKKGTRNCGMTVAKEQMKSPLQRPSVKMRPHKGFPAAMLKQMEKLRQGQVQRLDCITQQQNQRAI